VPKDYHPSQTLIVTCKVPVDQITQEPLETNKRLKPTDCNL
jgi:hypothetical protein